ncbi:MAG: hypothetical protein R3B89_08480 [Polyangiaceae bacterium]
MSLLGRHESSFELKSFDPPGSARVSFSPTQLWSLAERAAERLGRTLTGEQRRLVRAAVDGRDSLVLLPAGSGQSTAYLVAAQLLEQPTLVVHPLPSWLKSQQEQLTSRGVPCVRVDGGISGEERRRALERIRYSRSLVVLSTPAALQRAEVCRALGQSGVALAVLTDAHLFSEFSPEFGPSSASLDELLEKLGSPVAMVFSAVGSASVRADLLDGLRLREPTLFEAPLVRPNLRLELHSASASERQRLLISELSRLPRPGVVICPGPREVEAVHRALGALGVASYRYHRELSAGARAAEQLHFATTNKPSVLVAESAFTGLEAFSAETGEMPRGYGKGMCRMDLRYVLHFHAPHSLEQYLRDLALAGRNGQPAHGVLLYSPGDLQGDLKEVRVDLEALNAAIELLSGQGDTPRPRSELEELGQIEPRALRRALDTLVDAGLVLRANDWYRVTLAADEFSARAEFLLEQLEVIGEHDQLRLQQVQRFAQEAEPACLVARLTGLLGLPVPAPCGSCAECERSGVQQPRASEQPRRSAPRRFSVDVEHQRRTVSTPSNQELDFGRSSA